MVSSCPQLALLPPLSDPWLEGKSPACGAKASDAFFVGPIRWADRYAKTKDTGYKKVIRDNGLQLHSRSAVMETYGAFSKDLWSLVTVLTDPASHPAWRPARAWRLRPVVPPGATSSSPLHSRRSAVARRCCGRRASGAAIDAPTDVTLRARALS